MIGKSTLALRVSLSHAGIALLLPLVSKLTIHAFAVRRAAASSASCRECQPNFSRSYFVAQPALLWGRGATISDGQASRLECAGIKAGTSNRLPRGARPRRQLSERILNARQRSMRDHLMTQSRYLFCHDSLAWPFRSPASTGFYRPGGTCRRARYCAASRAPCGLHPLCEIDPRRSRGQISRESAHFPMPDLRSLGHIIVGGLADFYETTHPPHLSRHTRASCQADFRVRKRRRDQAMKDLDAWFTQHERTRTDTLPCPDKFGDAARHRAVERTAGPPSVSPAHLRAPTCSSFANPAPRLRAGRPSTAVHRPLQRTSPAGLSRSILRGTPAARAQIVHREHQRSHPGTGTGQVE